MAKKMNFKSKASYHRWLAYDKMHVSSEPSKHPVDIHIRGQHHPVQHCAHCGRGTHTHYHFGSPCCGRKECCRALGSVSVPHAMDAVMQLSI